jgi:hypothetical protein
MPTARSSLSCEARSARPVFGPGGLRQRASARGSAARRSSRSSAVLVARSPVALQRTISAHGRPAVRPAAFVVAGPSGRPLLPANADCVLPHAKRTRRSSREALTPPPLCEERLPAPPPVLLVGSTAPDVLLARVAWRRSRQTPLLPLARAERAGRGRPLRPARFGRGVSPAAAAAVVRTRPLDWRSEARNHLRASPAEAQAV